MSQNNQGVPLERKRRWRDYQTASGGRPVKEYLATLSDYDYARVLAAMKEVQVYGRGRARHVRGDIYDVRATGEEQAYRILFAAEGRYNHVLLSLEAFSKKTPKTPPEKIALAEQRLADWRRRGHDAGAS